MKNKYQQNLDPEEQELSDALDTAIDNGTLHSVPNVKEEIKRYQAYAQHTQALRKEKTISLRLSGATITNLKAIAAKKNTKYQTYISSVLEREIAWELSKKSQTRQGLSA